METASGSETTQMNGSATSAKAHGELNFAEEDLFPKIQQAVEKVKSSMLEVAAKAKAYMEDLTIQKSLDDAKHAMNVLTEKALLLKDSTAEVPVKALTRAVAGATTALEKLKQAILAYDAKHQVSEKLEAAIKPAIDTCSIAVAEISHYTSQAASVANARFQGVNDIVFQKVSSTATTGLKFLVDTLAQLDVKYDILDKAKGKLMKFDEKFGIQDRAKSLDEKYEISAIAKEKTRELDALSKGRLLASYELGRKMASDGLDFLNEEFEKALQERRKQAENEKAISS